MNRWIDTLSVPLRPHIRPALIALAGLRAKEEV